MDFESITKLNYAIIIFFGGVAFILFAIETLRVEHSAAVRTIWYFFFLSIVSTLIIGEWAIFSHHIGENGDFIGETGKLLEKSLKIMLHVNTDLFIIVAAVSVIIIPQLFSYLFSGASGCAAKPRLVHAGVTFLVWSVVKSFSVAAGIIVTIARLGMAHGWKDFNSWPNMFLYFAMCTAALAIMAFGVLFNYYELGGLLVNT